MRGLFKPSSYFLAQSPHSSHSLQYRAKQSVRGSLVLSGSMNSLGAEWRLSDCQRWSCCHSTKSNKLDVPLQIYLHDCWLSLLTLFTFAGGRVHPWQSWGEGKSLGACWTRAGGGVYPDPGCSTFPGCNAARVESHVLSGCPPDLRSTRATPQVCLPKVGNTGVLRLRKMAPKFTLQDHLNISHTNPTPATSSNGEWQRMTFWRRVQTDTAVRVRHNIPIEYLCSDVKIYSQRSGTRQ